MSFFFCEVFIEVYAKCFLETFIIFCLAGQALLQFFHTWSDFLERNLCRIFRALSHIVLPAAMKLRTYIAYWEKYLILQACVKNQISEKKVSLNFFLIHPLSLQPRGETSNKYCVSFLPQLFKNKSFRAFAVGLELLHGGQKIRLRDEVLSKEVPTFECHNTKSFLACNYVWKLLYCN